MLLQLLGLGRIIRDLTVKHWKVVIPIAVASFAFLYTKNHYYNQGLNEERSKWEQKVEAERKKNEHLTNVLVGNVFEFAELSKQRNEVRLEREIVKQNEIETVVKDNPIYEQCLVDKKVIEAQNQLKEMGP